MTQEQILESNLTKTEKIKALLELGLTRAQVAGLVGVGYGFVQNIFARVYPDRVNARRRLVDVINEAEWRLSDFVFNHTFGVEIEAYGIEREVIVEELQNAGLMSREDGRRADSNGDWKVTGDGSIHGEMAFELVSPKLQGEAGLRQLKTALLIIRGLGAKVNKSCGLHIHLNASNFNAQTWRNLFKNYALLEPVIDRFMPDSRRGNANNYCRSNRVQHFLEHIDRLSTLESAEYAVSGLKSIVECCRYYKLNVMSYWSHRSVEFRQHSGTTDFKKIKNWILFVSRLVEFSKVATVADCNFDQIGRFLPDELKSYFIQRTAELA